MKKFLLLNFIDNMILRGRPDTAKAMRFQKLCVQIGAPSMSAAYILCSIAEGINTRVEINARRKKTFSPKVYQELLAAEIITSEQSKSPHGPHARTQILSLTTKGAMLEKKWRTLLQAKVDKINLSLGLTK